MGKGIQLKRRSVVTTTWGEWKNLHPSTKVLSLNTGHDRDYGEGVAYKNYFNNDALMFTVPGRDKRLPNKREVMAFRTDDGNVPTAIDTRFLKKNRLYQLQVGNDNVAVITSPAGASRAYLVGKVVLKKQISQVELVDTNGNLWKLTESGLAKKGSDEVLKRYPSHQSFWFGWHAQFPNTRLIK